MKTNPALALALLALLALLDDGVEYPDAHCHVVDEFINYEDSDLYCDHCNRRIESAYGEEEE